MIDGCPHRPACMVSLWICGRKTELGHAIGNGTITIHEANALLLKYGESPIKGHKVYKGEIRPTLWKD